MTFHKRPEWQTLWVLAWPAVLLNALQTINSLLDGFFTGQLPPAALTAVGAATPTIFLFGSMTFTIGIAATALVSRFFGAKEYHPMTTATQMCLSLAVVLGAALALICIPASPLAAAVFAPPKDHEAQKQMALYLSIFALSLPPGTYIQALAGALRGIGDTVSPMVLSGIQILMHMTLNYLLIFPGRHVGPVFIPGAGWGLVGGATALCLSSCISAVLYGLWAKRTPLGGGIKLVWPGMEWTMRILNIAVPSGVLNVVRVTSLMAFTYILARTDQASHALAGLRLGISIESLAFMPAFGIAIAASALVGQSLGMKDPDRAARIGWMAGHNAAAVSAVMAVVLFTCAVPFSHILAPSQPAVAVVTASFLRHVASTEPLFAYLAVLLQSMQGAGDSRTPMWLNIFTLWLIRVPLAAVLCLPWGMNMGSDGAWLSMAITQGIGGVTAMFVFNMGRWKTTKV